MVSYFQGGYNEAKLYSRGSDKKIYFKCPDCGKIKNKMIHISTLYLTKNISCECSDKISYPEKFFTSILNQLNLPFEREFVFYGYKYRYDFISYSIKKNRLFIVETNGGLGHGNLTWNKDIQDSRKALLRDFEKIILSLSYNIPIITIDCMKSDKNYIKNSILNNKELLEYIDVTSINWDECDKYAMKNIIKIICEDYNLQHDMNYLSNKYKIPILRIKSYIKKGKQYGWIINKD